MTSQPLDTSASVKLNGSGNGQISLGPASGQMWTVT